MKLSKMQSGFRQVSALCFNNLQREYGSADSASQTSTCFVLTLCASITQRQLLSWRFSELVEIRADVQNFADYIPHINIHINIYIYILLQTPYT